jgi:hypothetical protein
LIQEVPFGHVHLANSDLAVVADAANHDIWVKALETTLTDEQKRRFQEHCKQREKYRRRVMLEGIVAELDGTLLLTAQQRERVLQMLEQRADELLMENGNIWNSSLLLRQLPADAFQGMLSEVQLECIRELHNVPALMDIEIEDAIPLFPALPALEIAPGNNEDDDDVRQIPLS